MKFECENCKKEVDTEKDKYVLVETGDGHRILDQTYFHFKCWRGYFNECIKNKINSVAKDVMDMTKQMVDQIKNERINY